MNKVILVGNLTKEPITQVTRDGKEVSKFTLAVNSGERTDFIDIVAWDKLASICNTYLVKGKKVLIEGELRQSKWQESNGATRYSWSVYARNMEMLSKEEKEEPKEDFKVNKPNNEKKAEQLVDFLEGFNKESEEKEMKYSDVKFGQEELPF